MRNVLTSVVPQGGGAVERLYDIGRTAFGLVEYAAYVFADDAEGEKLNAAQEEY